MRVCAWAIAVTLALETLAAQPARDLFQQGKRAEKKGDLFQAYSLYTQAAALEPDNVEYAGKSIGLRSKAMGQVKVEPKSVTPPAATPAVAPIVLPHPEIQVDALISAKDLADIERLLPPPALKATAKRLSLKLSAPPRELFERVLKAYGYELVFDSEYPEGGTPQQLEVIDNSYEEAIHALESLTSSFLTPLSQSMVLVCKDTTPKRQEQERTVAVMVPIPEPFLAQEAQELARSVQQVMELQKFAIDSTTRMAYMRGPVSKVRPAQALFAQLMSVRSQVSVEVELYEVNDSTSRQWGLDLPSAFNIRSLAGLVTGGNGISLSRVLRFLGGTNYYGIGIGDAQLLASMTHNSSLSLLKSEIRTMDNTPAQLHVGDKYPVQTAGFLGAQQGGLSGFQAPPTVQFEDLGLTLKVTPRIHNMEEVSLEIESEFKLLTGQAANGIPVIASRKYTGKVRLRAGEWAVVAGLVTDSDTTSLNGIPVLREIPGLGTRVREKRSGKTLLVLRPRILTLSPAELTPPAIWVGTEGRMRTPAFN